MTLTPRWLAALLSVGFVGGGYAVYLLASRRDPGNFVPSHDEWLIPAQLNSLILTGVSVVLVVTALIVVMLPAFARMLDRYHDGLRQDLAQVADLHTEQIAALTQSLAALAARDEPTQQLRFVPVQPQPQMVAAGVARGRVTIASSVVVAPRKPEWSEFDAEVRGFLARGFTDPPIGDGDDPD